MHISHVQRRSSRGGVQYVPSVGDHALLALKRFELFQDREALQENAPPLEQRAISTSEGVRWPFSDVVKDIPPDVDDTAMVLLFFHALNSIGGHVPEQLLNGNLVQFGQQQTANGGMKTYWGRKRNDVCPVVNTTAVFAYLFIDPQARELDGLQSYLNGEATRMVPGKKLSEYYVGSAYFTLRLAKLSVYAPDLLSPRAIASLDDCIYEAQPRNALEVAMASIAATYRGQVNTATKMNTLLAERAPAGFRFCTFYRQRTPPFNYGSKRTTQAFVAEALAIAENPELVGAHRIQLV